MTNILNALSPSEKQFLVSLVIICALSMLSMVGSLIAFNLKVTPEDERALKEKKPELLSRPIVILAVINYISYCSLWFNSAIIGAIVIWKGVL